MKRTYQSRRNKIHSKPLSIEHQSPSPKGNNENNNSIPKYDQIIHKYYRKSHSKTNACHNLGNNRISTEYKNKNLISDDESNKSDKENDINIRSESLESTTSFLSALSLKNNKIKKKIIINDELTLDDICNDQIDISEQYFDPESISDWPGWVSNDMIQKNLNMTSPNRKRKRNNNNNNNNNNISSPPSKKSKSPINSIVYSTIRNNNKRRSRRRSIRTPIYNMNMNMNMNMDMKTPIGSIRTQRIHRLTRKSNTDLLFDVLLRDNNDQLNTIKYELQNKFKNFKNKKYNKINFNDLNGLKYIGKIDNFEEKLCLYLLNLGANPLSLNSDGISPIYIAMHYKNNYNIIFEMINKCILNENGYEELNQQYVFAKHGTLSLLDIGLRVGEVKTVKLLLINKLMPTKHTIHYEPKIKLINYSKHHRLFSLSNKVLKQQLYVSAIENFDIDYIESIIEHGIDINIKMDDINKTVLYTLVQTPFNMYDQLDAKDQYNTINCLLKHGANPNWLDSSKTPMLIYPLQRSGQWNIKLVDILLYYGTNLKLKVGHTSKTLYMYAKENSVCSEIQNIITNYYKNNSNTVKINNKKIKTVQLKVTTNSTLNDMIKTKNINKKIYKRNRKSAKEQ